MSKELKSFSLGGFDFGTPNNNDIIDSLDAQNEPSVKSDDLKEIEEGDKVEPPPGKKVQEEFTTSDENLDLLSSLDKEGSEDNGTIDTDSPKLDEEPKEPGTDKEKLKKPDEEDIEPDDKKETSIFNSLHKDLVKIGFFAEGEEEINTPNEFLDRLESETVRRADEKIKNFIGQFGEDYQRAFEAIYINNVDPQEYFKTYNKIENFAEMDMSVEANQVEVLRQHMKDAQYDVADIEPEIERIKNFGELENTAKRYHKVLVKREAQKLQEIEQKAKEGLLFREQQKRQYIKNVNIVLNEKIKAKEFDGIPLNQKLAQELQDFLIRDKWRLPSGEAVTDFDKAIIDLKLPENHEKKVKVALLLKILETDPTLSTIQKRGVTKKTNELFSEVAKQKSQTSTKSSASSDIKWF